MSPRALHAVITYNGEPIATHDPFIDTPPWGRIVDWERPAALGTAAARIAADAAWNETQLCAVGQRNGTFDVAVTDYATARAAAEHGDETVAGIGVAALIVTNDDWWALTVRSAACVGANGGHRTITIGESASADDIIDGHWSATATLRRGLREEAGLHWNEADVNWLGATREHGTGALSCVALVDTTLGRNELTDRLDAAPDAWERDAVLWCRSNELGDALDADWAWAPWGAGAVIGAAARAGVDVTGLRLSSTEAL